MSKLVAASLVVVLLATAGNLSRSMSGIGVAIAVGVLWWLHFSGAWKKFLIGTASAGVAIFLVIGLQNIIMNVLNQERAEATQQNMEDLPNSHGTWHPLYLGLSWPEPVNGNPSNFDVKWDDLFGWAKAQEVNPEVVIGSAEYDQILKQYYFEAVSSAPAAAVKLYIQKLFYVMFQFSGMLTIVVLGGIVTLSRLEKPRMAAFLATAITLPTLLLGLIPPVAVMPMLYYYSEFTAALSLLVTVMLGGITWSMLKFRRLQLQPNLSNSLTASHT